MLFRRHSNLALTPFSQTPARGFCLIESFRFRGDHEEMSCARPGADVVGEERKSSIVVKMATETVVRT
jgi:hypothetical protein